MLKGSKFTRIGLSLIAGCLLFAIGGCTKYASEEDLQALERQKQAALAAEAKIKELEQKKADLERQITQKESELRELQRTLNAVKR